jgi:ketosteroid isomerase-like protein
VPEVAAVAQQRSLNRRILTRVLLLISLFSLGSAPARSASLDSESLAHLWVERLAATMEEHATSADVDRLLELYADDAVYEDPHAGARIEGKVQMRKGMGSHLGETHAPKIEITRTMTGPDFAVVEFKLKFEFNDGSKWVPLERRQVVVLELKDSRIQRVLDHWAK